jgi:hypothetical protein
MMQVRRLFARSVVVVAGSIVGATMTMSGAAMAEGINPCEGVSGPDAPDWCLEQMDPGTDPAPASEGETASGRGPRESMPCGWATIPAEAVPSPSSLSPVVLTNGLPPPGTAVTWQGWCTDVNSRVDVGASGPYRWLPADAPPPVPTPAEIALSAYQAIQGRIPDPVVATNPPVGVDGVVNVPVFVTMTNWQAELVETRDLLGNTVTVRATPEMVVSAAEPSGEMRVCPGGGRPYDPAAGDMWVQASAPGACAVTYQRRTGVEGRPDRWPSTVTVRWSISWSATSGESGLFPVVERSVSIARGVGEVQTVVVSGGG